MSKMNIFAAASNRVLAAIKQSRVMLAVSQARVVISESAVGIFVTLITKNIADALGVTELVSKVFGKIKTDQAITTDQAIKSISSNKAETLSTSDLIQKQVNQAKADQVGSADSLTKGFGKGLLDNSLAVESTAFAFEKSLTNSVFVTDDVGGEATIDDNQTITFFKVLSNPAVASDAITLVVGYGRTFQNSSVASDSVTLTSGYNRSFNESVSVLDEIVIQIVLPITLSDSAFASDSISKEIAYSRAFSHSLLGADSFIFTSGNGPIDSGAVSDQAVLLASFNRSFADTVIATDDIGGEATVDDNQTIQFFKQVTNLAQAADSAVRFAGKVVNDILAAADSGTLLNQDYVDNPYYFAEDYVGVKRTF